ncbi:MAG: NAD-dependent epimerase/dehydratase family protein [Saprospiraceae bacterium]|jgi:threonine 3-dehydrogenase|nr:NAD-dependent epimerase/dehydratase family protein [Saprospiraceae bacterium]MBP9195776.1 NAD-dependent epimerase/dehydratase family protein [Saprospiraceae bacterium]
MKSKKILITGANGQLGRVLAEELRNKYGRDAVLVSDIQKITEDQAPFEFLDILNTVRLKEIIGDYQITEIYHLAAILSAGGEYNPLKTWNINLNGLISILELAREFSLDKVFFPSTIAVFGKTTPRELTPQDVPLLPTTVYGISKTTGELWCNYYQKRYGVDVRSLRYPGIISYQSIPSGGTTDYAVEIFHSAIKGELYKCFLNADTRLPMMYIDDAIRGTIELMEADAKTISVRYGYNLAAMSFTPQEIYHAILKYYPEFKIEYEPDFRQEIASSWTESIDDSAARNDWGWKENYNLESMVQIMIEELRKQYKI